MIETSMVEGKEFADGIVLSKFLNVVLVWNRGGCFGLLRNVQFISSLLLAVALGVALTLLFCLWRSTNALNSLCFALVLGGALGNARDRIVYGAVVDFIDLHLGKYHWPVFNVADSAICIGLVLYLAADMSGANGKERRL
jgi:signal peptidase II